MKMSFATNEGRIGLERKLLENTGVIEKRLIGVRGRGSKRS